MNKSPPLINTILPISLERLPRPAKCPPGEVKSVILPFKNSFSVLKNPATENPAPGGPVLPVFPLAPVDPVAPLPVEPVDPIAPALPAAPLGP
jgi:hypothetical protein